MQQNTDRRTVILVEAASTSETSAAMRTITICEYRRAEATSTQN
jgi:hypothetical protein